MYLGYHNTKRPVYMCTVPNNTAQSCSYLFRLKHDVRCTSVTLKVVLPSASSNIQSAYSGVTCTAQGSMCQLPLNKSHNGHLAAFFSGNNSEELSRRELECTVVFNQEEIQLSLIPLWENFLAYH